MLDFILIFTLNISVRKVTKEQKMWNSLWFYLLLFWNNSIHAFFGIFLFFLITSLRDD
jgi:hypothetical protein